jgi:Spy/CpxP family protein refolding chaperone
MNLLTRKKLLAYLALIFAAGAVCGGVITWQQTKTKPARPEVRNMCAKGQAELKRHLELTPEQMEKIQPFFDETTREIERISKATFQQVEAVIAREHERILPLLTPEQTARFQQRLAEHRKWRERRKGSEGSRSDVPPGFPNPPEPSSRSGQ